MSSIMLSCILAMFFQLFLLHKMSEMFCHFLLLYQNDATLSPGFPVVPISGIYLVLLGPVVQTLVSANPGLNFNPGFFFFYQNHSLPRVIILFRVSNHQIVGKRIKLAEFVF